jgi:DUF1707 SHOCT-like domain
VNGVAGAESNAGGPVPRDQLRIGTEDRERVVKLLNDAFSEGRLEMTELEERVSAAYAAKTTGDLRPLTADLPGGMHASTVPPLPWPPPTWPPPKPPTHDRPATVQDLKQVAIDLATSKLTAKLDRDRTRRQLQVMREQRRGVQRQQRHDLMRHATGGRHSVAAWAATSSLCFIIWLIGAVTGGALYPWFVWVAGPWGIMVLMSHLANRRPS